YRLKLIFKALNPFNHSHYGRNEDQNAQKNQKKIAFHI
ncbi:MAG: hypothetical protein ACI9EW_002257, partial [Cellvibrionaceae bacterium]